MTRTKHIIFSDILGLLPVRSNILSVPFVNSLEWQVKLFHLWTSFFGAGLVDGNVFNWIVAFSNFYLLLILYWTYPVSVVSSSRHCLESFGVLRQRGVMQFLPEHIVPTALREGNTMLCTAVISREQLWPWHWWCWGRSDR
jgi:hypothetical protein